MVVKGSGERRRRRLRLRIGLVAVRRRHTLKAEERVKAPTFSERAFNLMPSSSFSTRV